MVGSLDMVRPYSRTHDFLRDLDGTKGSGFHRPPLQDARKGTARSGASPAFTVPFYLAAYVLPGLDRRFGWSEIPTAAVVTALALSLGGYLMILRVFH